MNNLFKIDIKSLLAVVLASAFVGFTYNYFNPDGITLIRDEVVMKKVSIDEITNPNGNSINELNVVDLSSAYSLWNNNKAIFIDARDEWDFAEGHIPNAINIAEWLFEPGSDLTKGMDKSRLYVVYCGGEDCDTSKRLAKRLIEDGFSNLVVFSGGWDEWIAAEYPGKKVEK